MQDILTAIVVGGLSGLFVSSIYWIIFLFSYRGGRR